MLPNCTKDACDDIHKSATKKQFYDLSKILAGKTLGPRKEGLGQGQLGVGEQQG